MKDDLKIITSLIDATSIIETVREPLLVLDADLKILFANHSFYKTFKVAPNETIGFFICDIGNRQWNIPDLRRLLEEILPDKKSFNDFEVNHAFPVIGHKVMLLNARQIYDEYIGTSQILLAIEDITERKNAQEQLEKIVSELQETLEKVKTLSGLLPICASCKNIRDDSGYWNKIESYIRDHSAADFTHGICPECKKKLYPELYKEE